MSNKIATPRQLRNLARGREINFQKQLNQRGIPQTIIQREIRQPIINQNITHEHIHQLKLSLFKELVSAKIFPIELNGKKENYNLQIAIQIINSRLDNHWNKILNHEKKLNEIVNYLNSRNKENEERFRKLEKRIEELEKENVELKNKLGETE